MDDPDYDLKQIAKARCDLVPVAGEFLERRVLCLPYCAVIRDRTDKSPLRQLVDAINENIKFLKKELDDLGRLSLLHPGMMNLYKSNYRGSYSPSDAWNMEQMVHTLQHLRITMIQQAIEIDEGLPHTSFTDLSEDHDRVPSTPSASTP